MSQIQRKWPKGCRAAVSLTYDDGIVNHPQIVAPLLEEYGFRGTFYVPITDDVTHDPLPWRDIAARGHELGNHTVFHPCWSPKGESKDWLSDQFNLANYTPERWLDEINTANEGLELIDNQTERTFGNTCFNNFLGPEEHLVCLEPLIAQVFLAARGEKSDKPVDMAQINFNNLGTVWADRRSFGDFTGELQEIIDNGGWVIYTFHGVGKGSHMHYIEADEHLHLLRFLRENADQYWTAPVIDVVRWLKR